MTKSATHNESRLSILDPPRNCWARRQARRAACLVDGEEYFPAAAKAMQRARHSILLLAWDFAGDARLRLGEHGRGQPDRLAAFLHQLLEKRPNLRVRFLVWDKAAYMDLARLRGPGLAEARMTDNRLQVVLDGEHPPLACHHQKVLVIDDSVAFCGGFDFAGNRWDTRAHRTDDPRRRTPSGQAYQAHHDVMVAIDGAAAQALGALARQRWQRATGERIPPTPPTTDAWPEDLSAEFEHVAVGIARTLPQ